MRPSVNHRAAIELNISGSHELFRMDTLKTLYCCLADLLLLTSSVPKFMPAARVWSVALMLRRDPFDYQGSGGLKKSETSLSAKRTMVLQR